jgi:hypothetical protein
MNDMCPIDIAKGTSNCPFDIGRVIRMVIGEKPSSSALRLFAGTHVLLNHMDTLDRKVIEAYEYHTATLIDSFINQDAEKKNV